MGPLARPLARGACCSPQLAASTRLLAQAFAQKLMGKFVFDISFFRRSGSQSKEKEMSGGGGEKGNESGRA